MKSAMYQWLLCNTRRHVAVTGQGYGRFNFIEPPLTCVTFMTCYITSKLSFIPAFSGEWHVYFSIHLVISLFSLLLCIFWSPFVTLKFYWGKYLFILILVRFLFAPSLRIPVCPTRSINFQTSFVGAAAMSEVVPTALILGHSFVRRFKHNLHQGSGSRASCDFNLFGTASLLLHGVGGRTV